MRTTQTKIDLSLLLGNDSGVTADDVKDALRHLGNLHVGAVSTYEVGSCEGLTKEICIQVCGFDPSEPGHLVTRMKRYKGRELTQTERAYIETHGVIVDIYGMYRNAAEFGVPQVAKGETVDLALLANQYNMVIDPSVITSEWASRDDDENAHYWFCVMLPEDAPIVSLI